MRIDDTQARPAAQRGRLGEVALRLRVGGVLAFLLVLGLAFSLLSGQFLTPQNLSVVAANAAILAIVACAQALVLLTRHLDVSVRRIMGLAAYLTADYAARHPGAGIEIVPMALILGAGLGAVNGLIVAYGRVSPLIATLGTMSLYRGFTYIHAHGQQVTSNMLPPWMLRSVGLRLAGLPVPVLLSIAVV